MRYRIKITEFNNGRTEFTAQVKTGLFWKGISRKGESCLSINFEQETRDDALDCIDKHHEGNGTVKSIDFEYIHK